MTDDPYSGDTKMLKGSGGAYRRRVGEWRILFDVLPERHLIVVTEIARRGAQALKLTPEQEKNWPAFEQAYRDLAKARADQIRAFREQRQSNQAGTDYLSRLQRRADALIARGNALKSFGAAAAPLYQSLDESQRHRFAALSRVMGPRHHHRFTAWHEQRGGSEQR